MASLADVFSDQERTNWLKANLAINIAKYVLEQFVDKEVKDFQTRIFLAVRSKLNLTPLAVCTSCCTANLLQCPTQNVCNKRGKSTCTSMHDGPTKQHRLCSMKLCDEVRDEIIKAHRYAKLCWKNTSAEQWENNHWQIAKCFLPPDGYTGASSAHETDFNGIISVMLNCKLFDSKMSFTIAQSNPPCLLSKSRDIGWKLRHNPDCKMKTSDLHDALKTLIDLLSDSICLAQDGNAQEAVRKLKQLKVDSLQITEADMSQLLKNAQETLDELQQVAKVSMDELKTFVENYFKQHAEQEEQEKDRAVEDFVKRLKHHYNITVNSVPLSALLPSGDVPINELYANPSIWRCDIAKDKDDKKTEIQVLTYRDIFYTGDRMNKRIFLQGEAGMGKSTFAAKVVLDWCNTGQLTQLPAEHLDFADRETLQKFQCVFHITLRDSTGQREVFNMIKKQIIDMIYTDLEREKAYKLLNYIMQTRMCLVIQDGLDEWMGTGGELAQPTMVSSHSQCALLITTRPWKLTDERIKDSKVDLTLNLKGVIDPKRLSKMVLRCLDTRENIDEEHVKFLEYINDNRIDNLLESPMLIQLTVCSWVDGICLTGSLCDIYSILIDCLFKKVSDTRGNFTQPPFRCFTNTKYLRQNIDNINILSKTAFLMLFSSDRENSLVVSDQQLSQYLSDEEKVVALKAGIFSERKNPNRTYQSSTCTFIHKSVQEFLAALYAASNETAICDITRYITENPHDLSQIYLTFVFLCGLNISAANKLSRVMDDMTIDTNLQNGPALGNIQNVMIRGVCEAEANVQNKSDIDLQLSCVRVYTTSEEDKESALVSILNKNTSNLKVLFLKCNSKSFSSTAICTNKQVCALDLSCFRSSETLCITRQFTLLPNSLRGLEKMKSVELWCKCDALDLSNCHNLETIDIRGDITLLTNGLYRLEKLKNVTLTCNCDGLDLSSCQNLENIDIREDITLLPNGLHRLEKLKNFRLWC